MPTYDYVCQACSHEFEHFQTMTSALLTECPKCKTQSLKRKIGAGAALIFKGSGFYCTDYKKTGSNGKSEGASSPSPSSTPAAPAKGDCQGPCSTKSSSAA